MAFVPLNRQMFVYQIEAHTVCLLTFSLPYMTEISVVIRQ